MLADHVLTDMRFQPLGGGIDNQHTAILVPDGNGVVHMVQRVFQQPVLKVNAGIPKDKELRLRRKRYSLRRRAAQQIPPERRAPYRGLVCIAFRKGNDILDFFSFRHVSQAQELLCHVVHIQYCTITGVENCTKPHRGKHLHYINVVHTPPSRSRRSSRMQKFIAHQKALCK